MSQQITLADQAVRCEEPMPAIFEWRHPYAVQL